MAWAALIPIAAQLLKGDEKQAAPAQQLPPPPSLGEVFSANQAKYDQPAQHSYPTAQSNPFSQFPIGGGSKGSNG
jgi:hypothetical protein